MNNLKNVKTDSVLYVYTIILLRKFNGFTMKNKSGELSSRIKKAREKAKLTQQRLASLTGVTKAAVSAWESGKAIPRQGAIEAISRATQVSVEWLLVGGRADGGGGVSFTPNGQVIADIDFSAKKTIPIYGQAVAGVNGEFSFNGKKLFEMLCPPQLLRAPDAYGVQVSGDSMYPRYEDGEIVYVDPSRRVKKGDYVVAQVMLEEGSSSPQAFIKKFIRHNEEELVLEQFNPEKNLVFPHERVVSVHYIALAGEGL